LLPLERPQLIVVLGCTVGAGQTVTTLMLADLLASLRGEPVAALDLNPGPASLTELAHLPATAVSTLLTRPPGAHAAHAAHAGHVGQASTVMHRGGSRGRGRLDVICQDAAPVGQADGTGAPASLQQSRMLGILASRYLLTLTDPGAAAVAKVLPAADQLVLVTPASDDAARAVSMTYEWLGAHGHGAKAAHAIAAINGVSRRTMQHAEQAELVLRGRSRAIVRVPWDDHLAEPEAERGIRASLEPPGGPSRLDRLHPAVLQAYTALAGVLISALAAGPTPRRAAR
jgi:MinD-like ATPase involved in chromosome partitioning or flagellar assembly